MQQITTNTIRSKHADVTLQNAICSGSFGSHQYCTHKENMRGLEFYPQNPDLPVAELAIM
jgi:hypothetical protein